MGVTKTHLNHKHGLKTMEFPVWMVLCLGFSVQPGADFLNQEMKVSVLLVVQPTSSLTVAFLALLDPQQSDPSIWQLWRRGKEPSKAHWTSQNFCRCFQKLMSLVGLDCSCLLCQRKLHKTHSSSSDSRDKSHPWTHWPQHNPPVNCAFIASHRFLIQPTCLMSQTPVASLSFLCPERTTTSVLWHTREFHPVIT